MSTAEVAAATKECHAQNSGTEAPGSVSALPAFNRRIEITLPHPKNRAQLAKTKSKEWNPATFFIVTFLLIGSMSINMIAVKTGHANFVRQSDVRIGLLREVVEKLQRGEKVDVEQVLGTGDPAREKEWEEMLRDIEKDNAHQDSRKEKESKPDETPKVENTVESTPTPNSAPSSSTTTKPSKISRSSFY
ncbi:hypothetical protein SAPIO_CDS5672 [Scedosporium apiospermum]|uniref:Uncharacterized protein n=1 Tax=Pseudallescheria apiosperma TaxID=563466 RepID=A0A084G553_PSEDA|nr:uncharacterized protein SAPIO_CDS5672 [Scedosporium apiospermum]KEZ42465.1 hypothetical protein SAPIO_CDS5672 [Scedosporium apiospermum]